MDGPVNAGPEEEEMKRTAIIAAALILAAGALAFAEAAEDYGARGALRTEELSLVGMLTYALQDEYLARAEYEGIMEEYGAMRPFSNIIRSEERHIEWLVELFDAYDLPLPGDDSEAHVVIPDELETAFEIGVQAEIDNIAMYDRFLAEELPADVEEIFERLKSASENHLRAFESNLKRYQ
jgi:hypothetical protein